MESVCVDAWNWVAWAHTLCTLLGLGLENYFYAAHDFFEEKKQKFCQKLKIPQNDFLGILTPAEYESGTENCYDVNFRV